MGALAKWDPQDDILLKNAVEAGASLESLAKGAVIFTRRFTLKELQDRWRALLYDPVTSAEASARIIQFESNPNPNPNSCERERETAPQSGEKRKRDSVRSHYYAMRKRVSTQPLETSLINGTVDSLANEIEMQLQTYEYHENNNDENENNNDQIAPFLSEEADHFEQGDYTEDLIMSPKICPGLEEDHQNQETENQNQGIGFLDHKNRENENPGIRFLDHKNRENENPGIGFRDPDPIWRSMQREEQQEVMSRSKSTDELAMQNNNTEISDFMDFSMDFSLSNELLFIDDKDIADTSCSMFLNDPHDDVANNNMMSGDVTNDITGTEPVRTETDNDGNNVLNSNSIDNEYNIINNINDNDNTITNDINNNNNNNILIGINNDRFNNIDNSNGDSTHDNNNNNDNINNNNNAQIDNLAVGTGEIGEKSMNCILSTEDPDIPDNADVFFDSPPSFQNPNPKSNRNCDLTAPSMQVSTERKGITGDLIEIKLGHPLVPVPVPVPPPNNEGFMDPPKNEGFMPLVPLIRTTSGSSQEYGTSTNPVPVHNTFNELNPLLKEDSVAEKDLQLEAPVQVDANCGCELETGIVVAEQPATSAVPLTGLDTDPLGVGPGSDIEDERVSDESEDEVPSFSDVEAMILEMDLCPYDQESGLAKEGMRFQSADSRKSLIRLEQGTRAYMNRAILARGAFAVLYGRHMKYFIKSPEVSIGRETEDIKVDIDLGKEGRANKISRRQAIIKLDENGSFHIKNIGKCAIFVNSKEVPAKKRINLTPGALIEIRDMRFIFEVNQKAVNRYVFTMGRTCNSQRAKFEWIPVQNI